MCSRGRGGGGGLAFVVYESILYQVYTLVVVGASVFAQYRAFVFRLKSFFLQPPIFRVWSSSMLPVVSCLARACSVCVPGKCPAELYVGIPEALGFVCACRCGGVCGSQTTHRLLLPVRCVDALLVINCFFSRVLVGFVQPFFPSCDCRRKMLTEHN